jgi:hypothetical protein
LYTEAELRESGLHLFRNFMRLVWKHLGLPEPTPVQLSIADTLQFAPEQITNGDRLIVQAFRGVGKSWITAAFALWNLFINPQTKILVVSASQPLADNFSIFCKTLIADMPLLSQLRPGPQTTRTSNLMWDVGAAQPDPAPSMKSAGITGQITGSRANLIIADDIEVPNNSFTHLKREKLSELVKEFDQIIKPGGRIVYLGTPHTEQSLYRRLEERGYVARIWTIEVPAKLEVYRGQLSPFILRMIERGLPAGTPVEPTRFPEEELYKRRAQGKANYALQNLLDTSPADIDAHPLKLRDLMVLDTDPILGPVQLAWGGSKELVLEDLPAGGFDGDLFHRPAWRSPEMIPWQGTVMYVDPSGRGTDETAYSIVRYLNGLLYWVDCGGFTDGFAESTLAAIAAAGARHKNNYVIVEDNFGGGMYSQLLKPHLMKQGGGSIDEDYNSWSRGQKELRICDTLQPVLESHRLVVDRRVIDKDLSVQAETPAYSVVYQLTRMKREKGALAHEDRVESLAGAVAYWTERMARDQQQARDEHLEEIRMKELEDFVNHAMNVGQALRQDEYLWHQPPQGFRRY